MNAIVTPRTAGQCRGLRRLVAVGFVVLGAWMLAPHLQDDAHAAKPVDVPTPADGVDMNQHGLTGSWHYPSTDGQGFLIDVFPDLLAPGKGLVAGGWFTFDATLAGDARKQRRYTFSGPVVSGQRNAALTLYRNTGGNFAAAPVTTAVPVGSILLDFTDCANGSVTHDFADGSGRSGTIPITRLTPNVTCTETAARPVHPDFAQSGNWFDPATSGQGFVVEINPSFATVFLGWYTYAPHGEAHGISGQRWYTGLGTYAPGSRSMFVTLREITGGEFDSETPLPLTQAVGTATITFDSCSAARLSYDFASGSSAGRSGTIHLTRAGPVPAGCRS